jgi:hypothetical protein
MNKRIIIIYCTILLIILYTPCAFSGGNGVKNSYSKKYKIDEYVNKSPLFIVGKSLSQIKESGKLKGESIEKFSNRYNSKITDEFITLKFDGLEIYAYIKSPNKIWPIIITVTKHNWKMFNNLNVGAPKSLITQILSEPDEEKDNKIKYFGNNTCITYFVKDKIIDKIELLYYVD